MLRRSAIGAIVAGAAAAVLACGAGAAVGSDGGILGPTTVVGVAVPDTPGAANCQPGAPGSGTRGGDGGDCVGGSAGNGVGNQGGSGTGGAGGNAG
ncbi:hypothetical protein HYG77_01010 [Rhodococcus sp. ZPP]|uniref:hypothetical protein n=1 Tax=Rhodococcus sp. ZPP TaxID=2749906 RepID=UPI001AD8916A|nr:hypothetical protein [Rhodococcus sp. ZPP]QTJ64329.1 hypothetical protein HYG77_01010 [Rhodococcus sp. ZPP]